MGIVLGVAIGSVIATGVVAAVFLVCIVRLFIAIVDRKG